MVILVMVSPFTVTLPSEPTSTPGSFLSRFSSISFSVVLNEEALYSMVSFLTMIGLPAAVTLAASSCCTSESIFTSPRSIEDLESVTACSTALYPISSALST